jgi:hypothetical protein
MRIAIIGFEKFVFEPTGGNLLQTKHHWKCHCLETTVSLDINLGISGDIETMRLLQSKLKADFRFVSVNIEDETHFHYCALCHKKEKRVNEFKVCRLCKEQRLKVRTFYCSMKCHRQDWLDHKLLHIVIRSVRKMAIHDF